MSDKPRRSGDPAPEQDPDPKAPGVPTPTRTTTEPLIDPGEADPRGGRETLGDPVGVADWTEDTQDVAETNSGEATTA